ncbi:hypothetical protein B296_00056103 [Ensete ventricosum]|uniref:Glycosyltransferase n=1 Tax=Ensete ventricosum TaxID=4639 RepID=A0A426X2Q1_ENSVE|nr:hypothetical protein B296_00056103 [Ensete ventricosum]
MGSPASKQHVAFVAFPFGSHPGAIFPVARAVAAAAPSAVVSFLGTVRALASLPPADDTPNLRFVAVADGVPDGSPPPREVLELIGLFLEATPGNLKEGMAAAVAGASGAPVSCVVSDAFVWMSGEVAEEMRVPWVPLCPGGTAALSAHLHTDLLRRKLGVGDQAIAGHEDELLDFIPGLSVHRVRDLPEGVVAGPLDSPFSVLLHRMAERLPKAAAIAFNTIPGLEPTIEESLATVFSKPFTIGPFHILAPPSAPAPDPNRCLPWLDRHRPNAVAYVSFGSIMTPGVRQLRLHHAPAARRAGPTGGGLGGERRPLHLVTEGDGSGVPAVGVLGADPGEGDGGGLGAAAGGAGSPGGRSVPDALRVELGARGDRRRCADGVPAALRRPQDDRQVDDALVGERHRVRRRGDDEGRGVEGFGHVAERRRGEEVEGASGGAKGDGHQSGGARRDLHQKLRFAAGFPSAGN